MAKTYVNTVKYLIKLDFEIDGIVDKPDIIGAIFGQSEGLLGDEMDLKELQKNGKLGRIEINHKTAMGRTKGSVTVPSSLDMAETSLLAAGIESVDKVGPCESSFKILDIEDTRTNKREEIKSRAQELLKKMMNKSSPNSQILSEELREKVRAADIVLYGPSKIPAGPDIDKNKELIVVEGRADVINLLKNQIKNVAGMNGSNISKEIIELCKKKEVTAFVDGDRGGVLNARKLVQLTNVNYIAHAPDGKEVEELERKEILQALKKRVPASEEINEQAQRKPYERRPYEGRNNYSRDKPYQKEGNYPREGNSYSRDKPYSNDRNNYSRDKPYQKEGTNYSRDRRPTISAPRDSRWSDRRPSTRPMGRPREPIEREIIQETIKVLTKKEEETYKPILEKLKGSMKAKLLDAKNKAIKEIKVKDLVTELGKTKKKPISIVFDGVITKRLLDAAEKTGVKYVIGARKGKIKENKNVKATAL